MGVMGILDNEDLSRLEKGNVLPLTAGDKTGDVIQQRAEQVAATTTPQNSAINLARQKQKQEILKPFVNALGPNQLSDQTSLNYRTQGDVGQAANIVQSEYDALGKRVKSAYDAAVSEGPLEISGRSIRNDLIDGMDTFLASDGYRPGDLPKLDEHISDLRELVASKSKEIKTVGVYGPETKTEIEITPANLKDLELWKKRLNATINNTSIDQKDTLRKLKSLGFQYDNYLSNLADDAIINGDSKAIDAFKSARSLAKQKFDFYESDKGIQEILDNRGMSGENLVNLVIGTGKITGRGEDGRLVEKILRLSGDRGHEAREAMRTGILAKVLKDGLGPTPETRSVFDMAGAVQKSLNNLRTHRELFEALFDETEQKYWKQFDQDLGKIAGKQIGAINRSGSGTYSSLAITGLAKVLENPIISKMSGGTSAGLSGMIRTGLEKQAAAELIGKAESGLGDFIVQPIKNIDANKVYYGSVVGSSSIDPITGITNSFISPDDEDIKRGYHITVRPRSDE